MLIKVNGTQVSVPDLDISLQFPTGQDPRYLVTLQAPVVNGIQLGGIAGEESDIVVDYADGTQTFTAKGIARLHTLRTVGGRDIETLMIELWNVQGL